MGSSFALQKVVNSTSNHIREDIDDYNMSISSHEDVEEIQEDNESNHESPSALPSNKYKHVMAINNSKLARKPYYKHISKNRFEREFCMIMDTKLPMTKRL